MNNTHEELFIFSKDIPISFNIDHYHTPIRHWHPATELLFVLSGSADIIIEDRKFRMQTEDVCLINSNNIHEIISSSCSILSIRLHIEELKFFDTTENLFFDLNSCGETNNSRYNFIRHLIAQLVKINASGENKYLTLSFVYGLISHLMDFFRGISPLQPSSTIKFRERISSILAYIEDHYREGITLSELAEHHNLSTSYFASFFEKNTGMTFLTYYNNLRLNYAVNNMLSSDEPLEKIALDNGFRDSRSFVMLFKKRYQCLPSEYRKKSNMLDEPATDQSTFSPSASMTKSIELDTIDPIDESNELMHLAKYLTIYDNPTPYKNVSKGTNICHDIGQIDYDTKGVSLNHSYNKLCCIGSARQFLYNDVQEMLRNLIKSIPYTYVKFHGILSDEMMVYMEKEDGTPVYSFTLVDKVFDFMQSIQLKPLVQLSFMPQALASDPSKLIYFWNFNTSPPKSMKKWLNLVHAFVTHLIQRYGINEVRSWLFCVWNEPDGSLDSFGWNKPQEFYEFYNNTYMEVKQIDAALQFGTPSLLINSEMDLTWSSNFFDYIDENQCKPDFLNVHYYDNCFSAFGNIADNFSISNIEKNCPLNEDPFAFTKFINQVKFFFKKNKQAHLPIYLTEWNLTVSHRDLINDTCFKACYLTKNLLENYDRLNSYGYWCLTDFIEEFQIPNNLYHGGLGMFTYNGIPKSHYNTFKFFTQLGNELIAKGNGYFVTKESTKIVIILYNYEHYSKLFASGILFDMSNENRYAPFTQMNQAQFNISFTHLPAEGCLIKEMFVNQLQGSSYDAWAKMGFPTTMRQADIETLKQVSQPGLHLHHEKIVNDELTLSVHLEPLEVRLIEIVFDV